MDISSLTNSASAAAASTASTAASSTAGLANETTFLQLLVAQIKNQDPTQPMDGTTFLTQLAQFSSLEQLIGINQGVKTLETPPVTTPAATNS
jgi:flagellar basal-body rod modification protein FlgD